MDARTYVLSHVAQYPTTKDAIIALLDSGMDWTEIAAIIRASLRDEVQQAARSLFH